MFVLWEREKTEKQLKTKHKNSKLKNITQKIEITTFLPSPITASDKEKKKNKNKLALTFSL